MRLPTADQAAPAAPVDRESQWRNLTEDLIFAAAYYDDPRTGSITWRRCLDARKIRYNVQDEDRKCRELCAAIHREHATAVLLVIEWNDPEQRATWKGTVKSAVDAGVAREIEKRYPLPATIQRAHAANESPVFRLRHASLLPARPS